MSKHRIQKLLDGTGGKITDRYGCIQDFGVYSGNESDRIKTYPVTLKVRTGGVLDHWLFGRIVMDFEGMEWHKDNLVLDWNHNADVEIGVILDRNFDGGDLICKSKLISRDPNDRVAKIVDYSGEGVPYEVSMTWGNTQSGKFVVEDVPLGKEALVNEKQGVVKGPVSIIRAWGMYGAAVCHHGVDSSTGCQFDSENRKGQIMPKDLKVFIDKFRPEKACEYMLDSKIETLEQAETAHKAYLDAKEKLPLFSQARRSRTKPPWKRKSPSSRPMPRNVRRPPKPRKRRKRRPLPTPKRRKRKTPGSKRPSPA